jgi:phosphoadenosine phosphosulfate reductase
MIEQVAEYNRLLANATPEEVLRFFLQEFGQQVAFATSLGAEDQVITRMIAEIDPAAYIFTLDTGRMFQETYDLFDLTQKKYKVTIHLFHPDAAAVESMVREKGINLFYESVENRKFCCNVRKIEPLRRALSGKKAWISGLRRSQSVTRKGIEVVSWDESYQLIKISPLANWSDDQVWNEIKKHHIPYNPLHDKGFPSIGCLPCTRAVEPGQDIRSGRWWWELPENKECGLHPK